MLVTTFLVLGCLAFALIIAWLVPANVWACLLTFGMTLWFVPPEWPEEAKALTACSVTLLYALAIWKYGASKRQTATP